MKRIFRNTAIALFIAALAAAFLPAEGWAWCWIRNTGITDANCNPGSTYQTDCCAGDLRIWTGGFMEYWISNSTAPGLHNDIKTGMAKWNEIEMSTFEFRYQGTDDAWEINSNAPNLVNIDASFCTHYPSYCDQGILGFSGTWSSYTGGYHATGSDIILNGEEYSWGDGSGGTFNTIAVVAHEGGHSAGLSHAGSNCQQAGSAGCGANFNDATMYYSYSSGSGDGSQKASLELDDIAALVYGYPFASLRVHVTDTAGVPNDLVGAQVELLDAAAPVNGSSIAEGGLVKGDVTDLAVLQGNQVASDTYVNSSPFNNTIAGGLTNTISPTNQNFRIRATHNGRETITGPHVLGAGLTTLDIAINVEGADVVGPTIAVTSHTAILDNLKVGPPGTINLAGTVTDNLMGDNGVASMTVDGGAATAAPALPVAGNTEVAWNRNVILVGGNNDIALVAEDSLNNTTNQSIQIFYDNVAPIINATYPGDGWNNAGISDVVAVMFNEDMDPATINAATFILNNGAVGSVTSAINAGHETVHAVLTPNPPLQYSTTYTATVTTGVKDKVGNPIAAPVSFTFTTEPAPASLVPSGGGGGGGGGCFIEAAQ